MQLNSDLLEKERENVELGRFVQNVLHSIGLNNLGHSNEPFIAEFVKKHINKWIFTYFIELLMQVFNERTAKKLAIYSIVCSHTFFAAWVVNKTNQLKT